MPFRGFFRYQSTMPFVTGEGEVIVRVEDWGSHRKQCHSLRVSESSVNERGEATTREIVFDAATLADKEAWVRAIETVLMALAARKREVQTVLRYQRQRDGASPEPKSEGHRDTSCMSMVGECA